jgi:hypothetical protein
MWSLLSSRVKVYCSCSWVQVIWSICLLLLLSSQSFQEVLLHGFFGAHGWLHLKFLEPSWTAQWKRNAWVWSFTVYLRIVFFLSPIFFVEVWGGLSAAFRYQDEVRLLNCDLLFCLLCLSLNLVYYWPSVWRRLLECNLCVYVPQKKQMCAQLELQKTCSWRCMCSCWRYVAFVATAVVVLSFILFCFFSINSCIQLLLLYDGFLKSPARLPASFEWVFVGAAVKQQLDVGRFF